MADDNLFICNGKLAGRYDRRVTPGGVFLEDIVLAVVTKIPWKEKKVMHIKITCWGEGVELLKTFKTGDKLRVRGLIEQIGVGDNKEFKLIATEIEKEKQK